MGKTNQKKITNKVDLSQKYPETEYWSVSSASSPDEKETILAVVYEKNPPIIFNPKSSVKRLEVKISSVKSQDEALLQHLLQKSKKD